MTLDALLVLLRDCPLVASVQSSEGSPLEDPEVLAKMALASASQGVKLFRAQGVENIRAIKKATGLPVIGLIKRRYPGSEVYITPTLKEVEELLDAGCEVVALDATLRPRPGGEKLPTLVERIHERGRLAMGDCDTVASVEHADRCGCDIVGTTLAGYTSDSPRPAVPALDFVYGAVQATRRPVLAEGRISNPRQAHTALRCGAAAFVVGAALNDPVRRTVEFTLPFRKPGGPIGAVDLGGTWLRFAVFTESWDRVSSERIPLPATKRERLTWIRERVANTGVRRIGIGTGGTVRPTDGLVVESKPLIPDHVGTRFRDLGAPCLAVNDGIAAAWGHACLPRWAGLRIVTLALGTGVGCGLVDGARIVSDGEGRTLKLNDLGAESGRTFEELLGGASLTENPDAEARKNAQEALRRAVATIRAMCLPDVIVVCGKVGMSEWLSLEPERLMGHEAARDASWARTEVVRSPFGEDAGLHGAAALALFPPVDLAYLFDEDG